MQRTRVLFAWAIIAGSIALCRGEEWPKWLGPNANGISTDPIAGSWPKQGPRKLWEQKVGLGYSSPLGFGNKVYLFSQKGNLDTLSAFDAESGHRLWSRTYLVTVAADLEQAKHRENGLPLPLATPTIDDGRIYTYGGGGDLVCRDLSDGKEIWHINVLKETHSRILKWNAASSPLVTDKLIYVQAGLDGPTAVAVDKQSGKLAWQSQVNTDAGYAAPIIADVDGTKQLIIFGGDRLYGMDPATGKTIWDLQWKTSFGVNAATPIYRDHHLFVSSDYDYGCAMLTLSAKGVKTDWKNREVMLKFQPAILDGDALYANSGGTLKCMHWPDGKILWEAKERKMHLEQGGSIVRDGNKLITMSERGKLSLVKATPKGYEIVSQVQLFDFLTTWSTPLIYHSRLYAMGMDTLVCLDIGSRTARDLEHRADDLADVGK